MTVARESRFEVTGERYFFPMRPIVDNGVPLGFHCAVLKYRDAESNEEWRGSITTDDAGLR